VGVQAKAVEKLVPGDAVLGRMQAGKNGGLGGKGDRRGRAERVDVHAKVQPAPRQAGALDWGAPLVQSAVEHVLRKPSISRINKWAGIVKFAMAVYPILKLCTPGMADRSSTRLVVGLPE